MNRFRRNTPVKASVGIAAVFNKAEVLKVFNLTSLISNPKPRPMRFIIADDSYFFRSYFKRLVLALGHIVVGEADNGLSLVEQVKKNETDFVLTDIGMHPLTGLDASIEILSILPRVKILCSTSENIRSWIPEMQLIGIKGYIYKNSGKDSLINAISSALLNQFYMDIQPSQKEIPHFEFKKTKTGFPETESPAGETRHSIRDFNGFVPRERELLILHATAQGKPVKQIAGLLSTTERNISKIKEKMRDKVGVNTNAELLSVSYKMGWVH